MAELSTGAKVGIVTGIVAVLTVGVVVIAKAAKGGTTPRRRTGTGANTGGGSVKCKDGTMGNNTATPCAGHGGIDKGSTPPKVSGGPKLGGSPSGGSTGGGTTGGGTKGGSNPKGGSYDSYSGDYYGGGYDSYSGDYYSGYDSYSGDYYSGYDSYSGDYYSGGGQYSGDYSGGYAGDYSGSYSYSSGDYYSGDY